MHSALVRRKVKSEIPHTHTLGSTQTISFYYILHTIHPGHDEYVVGIVSFVKWCDAHKSLAWGCTESLAKKSLWAQRCPHFCAITYLLELDGLRLTFSLEFKFLILHFCFQFVLQFTWKSKGHPLTLLVIILSMGFVLHNAVLQTEKAGFNITAQEKLDKCSIAPSCSVFPRICSSLENKSFPSQTDAKVGGRALFLNWRLEMNSLSLSFLSVWPPSFMNGGNHQH